MENLTKENFWNEMKEKYPKAMEKFCIWIDKYKEDNGWKYLFQAHIYHEKGYIQDAPKYHDLPLAMQFGIFIEYITNFRTFNSIGINNPPVTIEGYLKKLERFWEQKESYK